MTLGRLLIIVLIVVGLWQHLSTRSVTLGPGVMVEQAPQQTTVPDPQSFRFEDYLITPLADFSLEAKVLSREDYLLDRESDLAPTDLALGWQQMSDEAVLADIDIRQSGRWYRWRVDNFPVSRQQIETQSANMHMVPGNEHLEAMLDRVRAGQIIRLQGQLIRAEADDGWHWQSSLTRDDTGANACELVYLTALEIVAP